MSWEEMSAKKHECPCGKGTYTVRSMMDDWNRREERWEMDCLDCKQKYELQVRYRTDKGMTDEYYSWVPKVNDKQ